MSALPPKADIQIMNPGQAPADVCFTPKSGRNWVIEFMSAFDPKRTLAQFVDRGSNLRTLTSSLA